MLDLSSSHLYKQAFCMHACIQHRNHGMQIMAILVYGVKQSNGNFDSLVYKNEVHSNAIKWDFFFIQFNFYLLMRFIQ